MPATDRVRNLTQAKKSAMLEAIVDAAGNVSRAVELAGISRRIHYNWLASDPAYAEQFAAADLRAIGRLEDEARRRAFDGVEEPVFRDGAQVGIVRRYSDTLLIFLLKGAKPEKYRDHVSLTATVDVSTSGGELDGELRSFFAGVRAGQELADAGAERGSHS